MECETRWKNFQLISDSKPTLSIHFGLAAVLLQTHHRSAHEAHGGIFGDVVANDAPPLVIILKQRKSFKQ